MGKLFGTDGVRGVANAELTPELAFRLGRAATYWFGRDHRRPVFIIGRDTRISGEMLEAALAAGICSAGGEAVCAGVAPTPAVAFLARKHGAQAGVVISASHNPFPDNGIKFFAGSGFKLPDATEEELERLVLAEEDRLPRPTAGAVGVIRHRPGYLEEYINFVAGTVDQSFAGLKVVVDCANGAAYEAAPAVIRRLGAEVHVINNLPDGVNINRDAGSTHLAGLQRAVTEYGADLGIAHDGDADRCLAVDETGAVVDGDQIMAICALEMLGRGRLPKDTLVATVMSNLGLHRAVRKAGGKVVVTPVGDRYVLEEMLKNGYGLGGEQSGHIIFSEHTTTGDGLVTALQLIAAQIRSGQRLSTLAALLTRFPQVLVNVRVKRKEGWRENAAIAAAIGEAQAALGEDGRVLVRPSGTEPLIRVMAEGPSQAELEALVEKVAAVVSRELGS